MMNKRIFCSLLAALMLLGCLILPVCAAKEQDVVLVYNCDSKMGAMTVVTTQKTEGAASLRLSMSDASFKFASSTGGLNADVSNADTLAIDFYFSDPKKIVPAITEMILELTSSGTFDNAEIAFYVHQILKGSLGELKSGWNTVYFYFDAAGRTNNPDPVDLTKINFTRFFGEFLAQPGLADEIFLIDNIRVCNTGGPSFEDLENLIQFKGDNSDAVIEVSGIVRPNVNDRHNEITISQGATLDEADRVVIPDSSIKQPSISVNPDEQPEGAKPSPSQPTQQPSDTQHDEKQPTAPATTNDMMLVLVIVVCAAVVVIAVAVLVLVLVLGKAKKKN